ncbi:hypothetical protein GCM10011348_15760 [Marinobacterium nitratireducens]|uniref:Uncharacterized protein n=1 Tax=Marinobacterium nitratireducens TaxID=518897 RepID=A0A917ZB77_9GAMM|nr:hypothetical protein [Marinobacterium nitratireducens]GGO80016.1 hypothetical protein GCM10011348_15760 [Marinobacterium nitratireducens]
MNAFYLKYIYTFILLLAYSFDTSAQQAMTNDELFSAAQKRGRVGDWVQAHGYLMAYFYRNPPELSDETFRRDILQAIGVMEQNARAVVVVSTGTAGTDSRGDDPTETARNRTQYQPVSIPNPPQPPRSYRLNCRGGGNMSANYYPSGSDHRLQIHFNKSPYASRNRPPKKGECAWTERPLNEKEPFWIEWIFSAEESRIKRINFRSRDQTNNDKTIQAKIFEINGTHLQNLMNAVASGRDFSVDCYNNQKGRLIITRVVNTNKTIYKPDAPIVK